MAKRDKRDLDELASRFLNALWRISAGLEQQRQRSSIAPPAPPRLLGDSQTPVIDLTGEPGNDLDYYIYELARLQAVGNSIVPCFGQPPELVDAQKKFGEAFPKLSTIRNPLTHPNDNDELDEVAWFSSAVKLKPDGSVETLVDPRYEQHEVATGYHLALTTYLRAHLQSAVAADPPKPLSQQIAERGASGPDRIGMAQSVTSMWYTRGMSLSGTQQSPLAARATVFVSPAANDETLARWLKEQVEAAGHDAWVAEWDYQPGARLTEKVKQHLLSSDAVHRAANRRWLCLPVRTTGGRLRSDERQARYRSR